MRKSVKVIGKGYNEQQAKIVAYNSLKDEYKNNVLVYGMTSCELKAEPKAGEQCSTENHPAQGTRKWETKHNVYAENPNIPGEFKKVDGYATKGDAMKKAKEVSLQFQTKVKIKIEKELAGENSNIEAVITPKGAAPGEWEITLDIEVVA